MSRARTYPKKPHVNGQARCKIGGKDVYLGPFGSPESKAKFYRLLAEHEARQGAEPPAGQEQEAITVAQLLAAFWAWAEKRYVKNGEQTSEISMYRIALAPVAELYGESAVEEFGPLALMACRTRLIEGKYSRVKINSYVGRIRRVFKWGVSRQMVAAEVWQALSSVDGLRRGEAKELPPVTVVPQASIAAIEGKVLPPIWAMIRLQLATGMRPGEVCQMRTCDILRDDPTIPAAVRSLCWSYRPQSHKTEHHERGRLILLGPTAQELLIPWLRPNEPQAYLFSPREAVAFERKLRSAARKSKRYGKPKPARRRKQKRPPGEKYRNTAYAAAVAKGCKKAKIARWSPNRLRHNAATEIRKLYGAELARVILGHASLNTTEIYAERDLEAAAKAMASIG